MKHLKISSLLVTAALASGLFGASTASATTLTITGERQFQSITILKSLKSGSSLIVKDKNGTTNNTCTGSTIHGSSVSPYTGAVVRVPAKITYSGCSHTTQVLAGGEISYAWTSGLNGTVSSSGAEITIKSTVFGISAICKTGAGTAIGTLTGTTSGNATMDLNATTIDCGALGTSSMTGTYITTVPHALGVTS